MKPIPTQIQSKEGDIRIVWDDGHQSRYIARDVRLACRCAACVDEWTHEYRINPDTVPPTVKPRSMEPVGSYALQITWSDGHSSGLFTYDYLREICSCEECKKPRSFDV